MNDKLIKIQQELNANFSYNPHTGKIIRLTRKNSNGSLDKDGYLIIKFKGKQYKAHRLAWFLQYGKFPDKELDHINRNKLDNRIDNLRIATRRMNVLNRGYTPNIDTGVIGIYFDKSTRGLKRKYTTRVQGKTKRFYTLDEAINLRKKEGLKI